MRFNRDIKRRPTVYCSGDAVLIASKVNQQQDFESSFYSKIVKLDQLQTISSLIFVHLADSFEELYGQLEFRNNVGPSTEPWVTSILSAYFPGQGSLICEIQQKISRTFSDE